MDKVVKDVKPKLFCKLLGHKWNTVYKLFYNRYDNAFNIRKPVSTDCLRCSLSEQIF